MIILRAALMQYKPGAFLPGVAVQPVLVRYFLQGKTDTVTWTWDQPHGAIACILLTLTQWSTTVSIEYLPRYVPSEEEKDHPQLFADNVRQVQWYKIIPGKEMKTRQNGLNRSAS